VLQHRVKVERVLWLRDGKMSVRLRQEVRVSVDVLDALDQDGWQTAPWEDEPPDQWLEAGPAAALAGSRQRRQVPTTATVICQGLPSPSVELSWPT
jgi:hypothetical protein